MKIIFACENIIYISAIRYTIELAFSSYSVQLIFINYDEINTNTATPLLLSYGKKKPKSNKRFHIHIFEADFFGKNFLSPQSLPKTPLKQYNGLPIIFSSEGNPLLQTENGFETNLDIIASIFFVASRYEEFLLTERDEFDRFQVEDSLAFKERFLHRPIVDEYIALLVKWMQELGITIKKKKIDGELNFAICLTHDIDHVSGGWKQAAFYQLKKLSNPFDSIKELGKILFNRFTQSDLYWNFDRILDLEEQHEARSTFYFLPKTGNKKDARYDFHSKKFIPVFERVKNGGWEIGLHGSYDSTLISDTLRFEKQSLEQASGSKVTGLRQHFLRFDVRNSWRKQENAGFDYDTTLGFAETVGFRAGLARPYHPYNFDQGKPYDLIEIPFVIMDTSLRLYEKWPADLLFQRILPILESVERHNGAAAILWHNTYFSGYKYTGYEKVYGEILEWIKKHGGGFITAQKLVELFNRTNT